MQLHLKDVLYKDFVGNTKLKKERQWNFNPEFAYLQSFYQKPVFVKKTNESLYATKEKSRRNINTKLSNKSTYECCVEWEKSKDRITLLALPLPLNIEDTQ